jgi:hypothetical protein
MTLKSTRLALWLALCGILCLSAAVYALRTENERLKAENLAAVAERDRIKAAAGEVGEFLFSLPYMPIYTKHRQAPLSRLDAWNRFIREQEEQVSLLQLENEALKARLRNIERPLSPGGGSGAGSTLTLPGEQEAGRRMRAKGVDLAP